jgi:hypothetical protein
LPLGAVLLLLILVFALFAPKPDIPISDEWFVNTMAVIDLPVSPT